MKLMFIFSRQWSFDVIYLFFFDLVKACYFANPLPVELVPVVPVIGNWQERGIHIFEVSDYPVKTLMFKGKDNFNMLVALVSEICSSLQDRQIPFNLLISECSTKMFLFPQVIYFSYWIKEIEGIFFLSFTRSLFGSDCSWNLLMLLALGMTKAIDDGIWRTCTAHVWKSLLAVFIKYIALWMGPLVRSHHMHLCGLGPTTHW